MTARLDHQAELWNTALKRLKTVDSEAEAEMLAFLDGEMGPLGPNGLDIGCGLGRHMLAAARRGFHMWGIDLSGAAVRESLRLLRAQGLPTRVILGSMQHLPFASGSFDFSFAWCVLNHGTRDDFVRAVREAIRVVADGGRFYGFVMTRDDPRYGKGVRVAPDTYILADGLEAGICHYFPSLTAVEDAVGSTGQLEVLAEVCCQDERLARYHPGIRKSCHAAFSVRKV